ncbi:hypothetical protein RhiirA5_429381 [Rhizophagus irregularis]|uniref:SHSP domain-containing protein n=1 Tax=Rhizophagus irregularis TaxID=588596 RepID=A0A2I1E456_9GLOM|nr:hypothetical protein RhiirA5_429381 [Rhizophagus irregularis]PKC71405.1 hypothetical protein RhiirA1_453578 [Rhizophagus irregularis]PKY16923.1 hypothetical protein RhiirB3_429407 [Rhizophagus irregularis]PKY26828.1 hypothetical protein RhiirB3_442283 [Rhizophagus irregularis]
MSLISNNWMDSVSRIFDDLIKDLNVAKRGNTRTRRFPALEVHETEKEYIGFSKDQINADVRDNVLVISERRYDNFSRSISIPPNIKTEEVTAKFENGVLRNETSQVSPARKSISNKKTALVANSLCKFQCFKQ